MDDFVSALVQSEALEVSWMSGCRLRGASLFEYGVFYLIPLSVSFLPFSFHFYLSFFSVSFSFFSF
jgi:hypothetical protein